MPRMSDVRPREAPDGPSAGAEESEGAPPRVFLALGSNLGDRRAHLREALERLREVGVHPVRESSVHETPALMPEGAPADWDRPYLNQVVEVVFDGDPPALLRCTQAIERAMGRGPAPRWAPRVIDIDLVAFGDAVLETPELTLPHPQMHRRAFVLGPLCEIAPEWIHPRLRVSAEALRAALDVI